MNKVMTRALRMAPRSDTHSPETLPSGPPGVGSSRPAPSAAPPRTPGGGRTRTASGGGRPSGPSKGANRTSARPADTRPTSGPGRGSTTARRAVNAAGAIAVTAADALAAEPRVPAQASRRPVPRLRPTDVFADRLLAVLSGRRPVHFMLGHTAGRAYDELAWLAEQGPLRTTRGARPVIRDIGYDMPRPGAIEAFARIGAGDRLRAMAFRLELGQDRRWRCTAVELGGPRRPCPDED
ncbi:Rv3235 family protein [Streptomyces griseus]|uniref:Rv3235 family protein n=1 Tax=Streptomyces griseus TaxID=1911 RepID=UPI000565D14A|nr:Rv3235 family protein [Streptomyces griseus]